jgi:hypothetical protein
MCAAAGALNRTDPPAGGGTGHRRAAAEEVPGAAVGGGDRRDRGAALLGWGGGGRPPLQRCDQDRPCCSRPGHVEFPAGLPARPGRQRSVALHLQATGVGQSRRIAKRHGQPGEELRNDCECQLGVAEGHGYSPERQVCCRRSCDQRIEKRPTGQQPHRVLDLRSSRSERLASLLSNEARLTRSLDPE